MSAMIPVNTGAKNKESEKLKSDFERKRFIYRFLITAGGALVVMAVWLYFLFDGEMLKMVLPLIAAAARLLTILFIISLKEINYVYREVEKISEDMVKVVDDAGELPEEEYAQGTIGILYTNFLQNGDLSESKQKERELSEKVFFLRDIMSDISHQLKTPLASLNIFVDLLLDDKFTDEEKKKKKF